MSQRSDRELVESAQRGDGAAIAGLFSRYWRAARAAAFGVTGEFASAEDAASEAFRQALAGLSSLQAPERFGAWLRTIVIRKARTELQRRRAADPLADSHSNPPDSSLEREELAALVHHAMRQLPNRLRETMALVYFEGYQPDAAAHFLDIPPGTLRRRLHEGRKQLRKIVEQVLQGARKMNQEREQQIERFKQMIESGEIYRAFRESLALRPPPRELIDLLPRRETPPTHLGETVQQLLRPSPRATDPSHPVGAVALAIRKALPDFQEWELSAAEAAVRLQAVMPPGFAEGRPGAFLRPSRAILHPSGHGPAQSVYQLLQASPDEETFRAAQEGMRVSDVLDLIWMVDGPLELRSVQDLIERLIAAVLPGTQPRFAPYDEPRYRSALQLQIGDAPGPFARGGVLTLWPGRPDWAGAAHVRIFLEPWATVHSGQRVEFCPFVFNKTPLPVEQKAEPDRIE